MSGNRFKWMKARRLIGMNRVSDWPETLAVREIARLAFGDDQESRTAFEYLIRDAIATGELAADGEKRFEEVRQCIGEPSGWDLIREAHRSPKYRFEPTVARADFVAWEGRSHIPADSVLTGWWEGAETEPRTSGDSKDLKDPGEIVTGKQIRAIFSKLNNNQWRGHFSRESQNGLGAARIGGKGDPTYQLSKVCAWLERKGHYTPAEITTALKEYREPSTESSKPTRERPQKTNKLNPFSEFMPK